MKNILVLGATGSIGDSVLSVIEQNSDKLNLFAIVQNSNTEKAVSIVNKFNPSFIYFESKESMKDFQNSNKKQADVNILNRKDELESLINHTDVDIIVSAISGFAGLETTLVAARTGKKKMKFTINGSICAIGSRTPNIVFPTRVEPHDIKTTKR